MRIRATFADVEQLSIVDAQDHLFDLNSYLFVAYLSSQPVNLHLPNPAVAERLRRTSIDALRDTRVESISYASPLEVAMYVSALAAPISVVGGSLIGLFNATQRARMNKATADVHVASRNLVLEAIETQRAAGIDLGEETMSALVEGATRAALNLSDVQIETGS